MICITNKGEIPLAGIRLLGLSEKTPDQIGQFGTGLKESIALLMRLGSTPIIFSGLHRIDFSIQNEPEEIFFKITGPEKSEELTDATQPPLDPEFENDVWHGMGMHQNFGKHDWTEPWQALREIYCNALDAGKMGSTLCNPGIEPMGEVNWTKVYIPTTEAILAANEQMSNRLLAMGNRLPVYSCDEGKCFVRSASPTIFMKGVYIQEANIPGLFDYELAYVPLNESRSADWFDIYLRVAKIITSDSSILHKVMQFSETKEWEDSVEKHAIAYYGGGSRSTWVAAFNVYGERTIAVTSKHHAELVAARGYYPRHVAPTIYDSLKRHAGPTAASVIGNDEADGCEFESVPVEVNKFANKLWAKLVELRIVPGHMQRPRLEVFRNLVKPELKSWTRQGVVGISSDILGTHQAKMAMLEGFMRTASNSGDLTRAMQDSLISGLLSALRLV